MTDKQRSVYMDFLFRSKNGKLRVDRYSFVPGYSHSEYAHSMNVVKSLIKKGFLVLIDEPKNCYERNSYKVIPHNNTQL